MNAHLNFIFLLCVDLLSQINFKLFVCGLLVIEIITVNVLKLAHTLILLVVYDTPFWQSNQIRSSNRPNQV